MCKLHQARWEDPRHTHTRAIRSQCRARQETPSWNSGNDKTQLVTDL